MLSAASASRTLVLSTEPAVAIAVNSERAAS